MKILVISDFAAGDNRKGCGYKVRFNTAAKFAVKGHEVTFVAPSACRRFRLGKEVVGSNLRVIKTPGLLPVAFRSGGFGSLDILHKLFIVLRNDYDVIQVTNGHRPANFLPCLIGKYIKGAVIVDECWEWLGKGGYADRARGIFGRLKALYDRMFEVPLKLIYDDIIVISSVLQRRFNKNGNAVIIHGGSVTDMLQAYPIQKARRDLNIEPGLFILGMSNVTSMDHEDNRRFFEAFKKLTALHDQLRLVVTGPNESYIQNIIDSYGLGGKVISPGWVDFDIYNKYLSACDLFVLPYPATQINTARWPNKISDYLCLNRPILSNPTGDLKEYFEKYAIGMLCQDVPEDYFQIIFGILQEAKDLSPRCADALHLAHDVLSFDTRVEKFIGIFENRMRKRKR